MQSRFTADRTRTVDLDHEQLLVIEDRPGTRVQVLFGGLWLTEERRLDDRFAVAGEALCLRAEGRAVLESIGRTRLRIIEPARRAGAWWGRALSSRRLRPEVLGARVAAAALALILSVGLPEMLSRGFQRGALAVQSDLASHSSADRGHA